MGWYFSTKDSYGRLNLKQLVFDGSNRGLCSSSEVVLGYLLNRKFAVCKRCWKRKRLEPVWAQDGPRNSHFKEAMLRGVDLEWSGFHVVPDFFVPCSGCQSAKLLYLQTLCEFIWLSWLASVSGEQHAMRVIQWWLHRKYCKRPSISSHLCWYISDPPPPSNSCKWRFIGISYKKCQNPGGDTANGNLLLSDENIHQQKVRHQAINAICRIYKL